MSALAASGCSDENLNTANRSKISPALHLARSVVGYSAGLVGTLMTLLLIIFFFQLEVRVAFFKDTKRKF